MNGRTAATVGGTIAAVPLGGAIGRDVDAQDKACIAHALEFAESGQKVSWCAPRCGRDHAVTPGRIERQPDGRDCRAYDTDIVIGAGHRTVQGMACRQPDGLWSSAD